MNETLRLSEKFHPMEPDEMHETYGGILAAIFVGLTIAAGAAIINDWDNFKNGLMARPEEK